MTTILYYRPDGELFATAVDMPGDRVCRMVDQITDALKVRVHVWFPNGSTLVSVPR